MHAYNCICANVPAQHACIAALTEGLEAPQYMNQAYIERRDYLINALTSLAIATCAFSKTSTQKLKSSSVYFLILGKM
jgi:aspartate/methionine/tyrosine aminotransferase